MTGHWNIVWSRGAGTRELAESLGEASPVEGNLKDVVVSARADLLVSRKLSSFDLVPMAVPSGFDRQAVTEVVAAVGGGPHSELAAAVAGRLAATLSVPGLALTASSSDEEDLAAESALEELSAVTPFLTPKVVRASSARELVDDLPPGALLVLGAPGGSWLQRQFFGPGRRLVVSSPGGTVVVRSAPRRCFQEMSEPAGFGPEMSVTEALRLMDGTAALVVESGRLVGLVRRERLESAAGHITIGSIAEDPVFVHDADPIEAANEVAAFAVPVPVIDDQGRLVGVIGR
jgi:CBS domain-containing protein